MLLAFDTSMDGDELYPLDPVEDGPYASRVYYGKFYTLYTIYFGY